MKSLSNEFFVTDVTRLLWLAVPSLTGDILGTDVIWPLWLEVTSLSPSHHAHYTGSHLEFEYSLNVYEECEENLKRFVDEKCPKNSITFCINPRLCYAIIHLRTNTRMKIFVIHKHDCRNTFFFFFLCFKIFIFLCFYTNMTYFF